LMCRCGKSHRINSPKSLPIDKRILGALIQNSHKSHSDPWPRGMASEESLVEFRDRASSSNLVCKEHALNKNRVYLRDDNVLTGCSNCVAAVEAVEDTPIKVLRTSELSRLSLSSEAINNYEDEIGSYCGKSQDITRKMNNIKKEDKLNERRKAVVDYFDRIHSALELQEHKALKKIEDRQAMIQEILFKAHSHAQELDHLLNSIRISSKSTSHSEDQIGGNFDLVELILQAKNEMKKVRELKEHADEVSSSFNITTDPNLESAIRSSIYVDRNNYETPPDTDEDYGDMDTNRKDNFSIFNEIKQLIVSNSSNISTPVPIKPIVNAELQLKTKLANMKEKKICKKIIIDADDDSDSSYITDEVEDKPCIEFLDLKEGNEFLCDVISFESPDDILVRPVQNQVSYKKLRYDMASHYNGCKLGSTPPFVFEKGTLVVVKDEEESWCRAKILSINDTMVELYLVDLDDNRNEKMENLQPLVGKFMSLPQMVLRVTLSRIRPIGAGDKWAYDTLAMLEDLLVNPQMARTASVKVESLQKEEHCLQVTGSMSLTYVSDDDPFGLYESTVYDLATLLIDEGLAFSLNTAEKLSMLKIVGENDESIMPKWRESLMPDKNEFKASVQWLDNDCIFYLSVDEWEDKRQKLFTEINSMTFNMTECPESKNKHWKIGQAVLAKYTFDNLWYRAEIVRMKESHIFDVKFVDFGQIVQVQADWICDKLLGMEVPSLVMPVLLDIIPLNRGGSWEKETLDRIHAIVDGEVYHVKVMGYGGPYPLYVEMQKFDADGRKQNLEEILIDNKLVKKGHRER